MKILGNGTRGQKEIVQKTLELVGNDIGIITKIEVYNTDCVEKFLGGLAEVQYSEDKTTGFAILPDPKRHIKGNRIVLAGKNPFLAHTTLHELGHLVNGKSEILADEYAAKFNQL